MYVCDGTVLVSALDVVPSSKEYRTVVGPQTDFTTKEAEAL